MQDMILHVKDLEKFRSECIELFNDGSSLFSYSGNSINYKVCKTKVIYSGNESICLVRGLKNDVNNMKNINIIGYCVGDKGLERYEFTSESGRLTYERVRGSLDYGYNKKGMEVRSERPYMIGVFA